MTGPRREVDDFDLGGVVRVRLVDATEADVATVRRQLGLVPVDAVGGADVLVRFVEPTDTSALTYVQWGETGYDDRGLHILKGKGSAPVRMVLPFDAIGRETVELFCEHGAPAVPHLVSLINLLALSKGVLPLHASAFTLDGHGIVVTGWAKSGKTEVLVGAAAAGASYVGDEWVYLTPDGGMFGLPEPIRLRAWHLDQRSELRALCPPASRRRLSSWRTAARLADTVGAVFPAGGPLVRKAVPVLQRQAYVQLSPERLFEPSRVDLEGRVDGVVMLMSRESPGITISRPAPGEVASRMAASLLHEREPFLTHYRQFQFAFPDRRSALVDEAPALERRLLTELVEPRVVGTVSHPYPFDITALTDAVLSAAEAARNTKDRHGAR